MFICLSLPGLGQKTPPEPPEEEQNGKSEEKRGGEGKKGRWDGGRGKEGGEERVINHKTLSPHNLHVQTNPQVIIPTCVCSMLVPCRFVGVRKFSAVDMTSLI